MLSRAPCTARRYVVPGTGAWCAGPRTGLPRFGTGATGRCVRSAVRSGSPGRGAVGRDVLLSAVSHEGLEKEEVSVRGSVTVTATRTDYTQDPVPHGVHRILADISDETVRWEKILHPPGHDRSGTNRWTLDAARREVGHQVSRPVTPQEKMCAIRTWPVTKRSPPR
ncbi:DUF6192 family protein [Streptomyces sp. SP17KL33]|nr:DUF6192 family protein [Streptomyces sp. SP17KL33]MEE1836287.1 DUF6192 family protein [Streptomyces sp. SP17KL33]